MKLPPEWWPQSAVMLTWPHAAGDWGDNLDRVESTFAEIATHISQREAVLISARDPSHAATIRTQLDQAGADRQNVDIGFAPSNDIWVRDHGPLTTLDHGQPRLLDFTFNGWGGKYPAALDNQITRKLHEQGCFGDTALQSLDMVVEGGAIEVNGAGCLLTTRRCLGLSSRNPDLSEAQIGARLGELLGCNTVHWLSQGHLAGDDTDGHIDTLARFAAAGTIIYQGCDRPDDEHYAPLQAMAKELAGLRQPNGEPYQLHALPLPAALYNAHGQRLPAGYANFLIINDAVLMPGYNDPADGVAARILADCFPQRQIITIDCRALVAQYGSLHCATMQLPEAVSVQSTS